MAILAPVPIFLGWRFQGDPYTHASNFCGTSLSLHCSHPHPYPHSFADLLGAHVSLCCEHRDSCPPEARSSWGAVGTVPRLTTRFLPLSPAPSCSRPRPAAPPTHGPGSYPPELCGGGESSGRGVGDSGDPEAATSPGLGGGGTGGAGPTARSVPPHAPPRPDSEGLGGRGQDKYL